MVAEYKSKREKFQAAKLQAADEQRPVREMERIMDCWLWMWSYSLEFKTDGQKIPTSCGNIT